MVEFVPGEAINGPEGVLLGYQFLETSKSKHEVSRQHFLKQNGLKQISNS